MTTKNCNGKIKYLIYLKKSNEIYGVFLHGSVSTRPSRSDVNYVKEVHTSLLCMYAKRQEAYTNTHARASTHSIIFLILVKPLCVAKAIASEILSEIERKKGNFQGNFCDPEKRQQRVYMVYDNKLRGISQVTKFRPRRMAFVHASEEQN